MRFFGVVVGISIFAVSVWGQALDVLLEKFNEPESKDAWLAFYKLSEGSPSCYEDPAAADWKVIEVCPEFDTLLKQTFNGKEPTIVCSEACAEEWHRFGPQCQTEQIKTFATVNTLMGSSLLEFLDVCAATLGNELPVVEGVTDVVSSSSGVTTTTTYSSIMLSVVVVVVFMAIVF